MATGMSPVHSSDTPSSATMSVSFSHISCLLYKKVCDIIIVSSINPNIWFWTTVMLYIVTLLYSIYIYMSWFVVYVLDIQKLW